MSLSSFLKNQDVKDEFARQFHKPGFTLKKEILAPPITNHYSLVGTAFDYLMRFYLKHLNPDAVTKRWVAELVLLHRHSALLEDAVLRIDERTGRPTVISFTETDLTTKAQQIIEQAKITYARYLSSGEMTDEVIESAVLLAQLDPIFRAGFIDNSIGTVYKEDVADLRNLISIVDPGTFEARRLCILNPTFGEGSRLVGGADVDLLIDDALIDIKTTENLRLTPGYLNQLVEYYILSKIGGVDDVPYAPKIERIGIHYSRYAELYTVPVTTVVDQERLPLFIEWSRDRATSE
jgi:hypothetical protein